MMRNLRIAEIITKPKPDNSWKLLKQVGIDEVVGTLPRAYFDWRQEASDDPWSYSALARYRDLLSDHGFRLACIEDNPPMNMIKYGREGREEELENVFRMIENMGKLGVGIWCYNWMAGVGWMRTRTAVRTRGDALTASFSYDDVKNDPPPKLGTVSSDTLWKTLKWFLERVIPVAEENGVKLSMHPDDPPLKEVRGVSRIMNSIESYDRLIKMVKSDSNTITLCQGNFTLIADDLPNVIEHFVKLGKVSFVHFRDVSGTPENFHETFIDEGKTDMASCLSAYLRNGFDGIMRTDHSPLLYGDESDVPGYSILSRLHAIGYIQGLYDSLKHEKKINSRP